MAPTEVAVPVRPGEHACCRLADAADREQLTRAFVRDGLRRGHKVVYFVDHDDVARIAAELAGVDEELEGAVVGGQLSVVHVDDMLAAARAEHARAMAEGYPAVSLTGEMPWALSGEQLAEYERRLAELMELASLQLLCQYDHARFDAETLADVATKHAVDVSPELAPIGRCGYLAAARVHPDDTLRLAGELDFAAAGAVTEVIEQHFDGPLRLDLADLEYVDVAGLRTLRGSTDRSITIADASEPVRRLLELLGWDHDPRIEGLAS